MQHISKLFPIVLTKHLRSDSGRDIGIQDQLKNWSMEKERNIKKIIVDIYWNQQLTFFFFSSGSKLGSLACLLVFWKLLRMQKSSKAENNLFIYIFFNTFQDQQDTRKNLCHPSPCPLCPNL